MEKKPKRSPAAATTSEPKTKPDGAAAVFYLIILVMAIKAVFELWTIYGW